MSRKPFFWFAVAAGCLALACVAAYSASYYLGIRSTVASWTGYGDEGRCVEEMGGPDTAREKLEWYLGLSERLAPDKGKAIQILGACGQPAVRILAKCLNDTGGPEFLPLAAAEVLGRSQFDISEAVPGLLHCARSSDGSERWAAAFALQRYSGGGVHDDAVLATLLGMARDTDLPAKVHALRALTKFGHRSQEVVPALISALADKRHEARSEAANTLGVFGPVAKKAMPALSVAADADGVASVREAAREALGRVRGQSRKLDEER